VRSILIFPYVIPTVLAVILWKWLLNSQFGLINHLMEQAGLIGQPISWMGKDWIMVSLILVSVWQFFPFVVLAVLARLNAELAASPQPQTGEQVHAAWLGQLAPEGFAQKPPELPSILSGDEFLKQTTGKGSLPLDTGADEKYYSAEPMDRGPYKHGALSHLIQWLIIHDVITERLGETPYSEAYKQAYKDKQRPPLVEHFVRTSQVRVEDLDKTKVNSLWTALVDLPYNIGIRLDATMPEGLTSLMTFFPAIKAVEDQIEKQYLMSRAAKPKQPALS
jgi:hypothetical protein